MRRVLLVATLALAGGSAALAELVPPEHFPKAPPGRMVAQAQLAACTATEILATNEKKGIDGKLDAFRAKLSKPPFASFDTFKFLGESQVTAEHDKSTSVKLAYGALSLLYKDRVQAPAGKFRLRFGVDVDDKDGKRTVSTTVVFDSGDTLFPIAGVPFQGGTYVLALTCRAQ